MSTILRAAKRVQDGSTPHNPLRAEISMLKRLTAMVDAQVSKDADRARQLLDAQKGKV